MKLVTHVAGRSKSLGNLNRLKFRCSTTETNVTDVAMPGRKNKIHISSVDKRLELVYNSIILVPGRVNMKNGEIMETVNHTAYRIYREYRDRDEYFSGRFRKNKNGVAIPSIVEDWQAAKTYPTVSSAIVAYKKVREFADGDWQIRLDETICKSTWFVPHPDLLR